MSAVRRTIVVAPAVDAVWAFLSDFRTTEDWDPPTLATERTGGEGGVGTTYHNVSKFRGQRTEVDYEVVEVDEPRLLRLRGVGSTVVVDLHFDLAPTEDGGCQVTYEARFAPRGDGSLDPAFQPAALAVLADYVADSLADSLEHLSRV